MNHKLGMYSVNRFLGSYILSQGWEGSRYCVGRAWIEAIFWLGICVGEPFFGYLVLKRHFLLILKILYVCLKSLDTISVSESPTQIFCIGDSLANWQSHSEIESRVAPVARLINYSVFGSQGREGHGLRPTSGIEPRDL